MVDLFVPEATVKAQNLLILAPFLSIFFAKFCNFCDGLVGVLVEKQILINIASGSERRNVPIMNFESLLEQV